jgi:hypothetical protein
MLPQPTLIGMLLSQPAEDSQRRSLRLDGMPTFNRGSARIRHREPMMEGIVGL